LKSSKFFDLIKSPRAALRAGRLFLSGKIMLKFKIVDNVFLNLCEKAPKKSNFLALLP